MSELGSITIKQKLSEEDYNFVKDDDTLDEFVAYIDNEIDTIMQVRGFITLVELKEKMGLTPSINDVQYVILSRGATIRVEDGYIVFDGLASIYDIPR